MNSKYLFALEKLNRLTMEMAEFHEISDKVSAVTFDGMGHVIRVFNFELMGYKRTKVNPLDDYNDKITFLRINGHSDLVPFFQLHEEIVYNIFHNGKRTSFFGTKLEEINERIREIRHFQKLFGKRR